LEPIRDWPQSKLERCGIEPDKIRQVVRDRIAMEGMQDDFSIARQMSFERAGENQKRQFHFLVEAAGDMDGVGRIGSFRYVTGLYMVKVGCRRLTAFILGWHLAAPQ
jgi:hypothetical protein